MTNGDYLINNERIELGVTQEGEIIDDVQLPSWAEVYIKKKKYQSE